MKRILFLLSVIAVMLLPMAGVSAASSDFSERVSGMAEITAVRVNSGSDKIRIVVDASKPVRYTTMTLKNPDRVIVDIQGAWLSAKVKREIAVSSRFVNDIRIGQFNKNTVRLVVENKVGSSNYKIFPLTGGTVPGRVVLDFGNLSDSSKAVIAPVFAPMGFGDWRISTALITGFMAKESVVSTLSVLFGQTSALLGCITPVSAASLLVFCLLYTPCVAAIASIKRELGSKWAVGVVIGQCVIAWVAAFVVYLVGSVL